MGKKIPEMLKLTPKDKAQKTWKFRHLPLCAKGATLNHCCLRQDPLEAILVIFGRRALNIFCLKALEKNEK